MSKIKTPYWGLIVVALLTPPAAAQPLYETFAVCTGRFSAEMEHAWLMGAEADTAQDRRAVFLSLLDAATPQDQRRHALSVRIDAKLAHAQILTQATFGQGNVRAVWALRRAKIGRDACETLLLDS